MTASAHKTDQQIGTGGFEPELVFSPCPHFEGLQVPAYHSEGAAGLDLCAACPLDAPMRLAPAERVTIPTGLRVAIPEGYEGQVRIRSGIARSLGLACLNAPGTIDSDYRGEIMILVINLGSGAAVVNRGDRVAQLVIAPIARVEIRLATDLPDSARGSGGFGSTGVRGHRRWPGWPV